MVREVKNHVGERRGYLLIVAYVGKRNKHHYWLWTNTNYEVMDDIHKFLGFGSLRKKKMCSLNQNAKEIFVWESFGPVGSTSRTLENFVFCLGDIWTFLLFCGRQLR